MDYTPKVPTAPARAPLPDLGERAPNTGHAAANVMDVAAMCNAFCEERSVVPMSADYYRITEDAGELLTRGATLEEIRADLIEKYGPPRGLRLVGPKED